MQNDKLQTNLSRIGRKIVVMSGKGGVGKSTVAVNLAAALAASGLRTGLLDVDIHGPSVPRMLSLSDAKPHVEPGLMEPVSWSRNLRVMSLGFFLDDPETPVIWRGGVKIGMIRRFLEEVAWGDLDALVVDCPPGTGDEPLTVLQLLGPSAYALIVTTPQALAVDDVRRSAGFCRELGVPALGIIENQSGHVCENCGHVQPVFTPGGGAKLAAEAGVPFLGAVPMDPEIARSGDEGYVYVSAAEGKTAEAFRKALAPVLAMVAVKSRLVPQPPKSQGAVS
ncbi:MAG: Mrp/NBP35 family ATP-binding protein [Desulfovibrionaceae bacterium]|nr:Mrp/NBP35 family ATP-binding protein [Desulfovibrionaceae bacterium]MBF0514759.1 Mrp/NBP35 family ATP-binding protein [Desulfovibrionaceae bacterium]